MPVFYRRATTSDRHMRTELLIFFPALAGIVLVALFLGMESSAVASPDAEKISLPGPRLDGTVSVEKALYSRRSVRAYKDEALALSDVSQLLWAAQGTTGSPGRTAPSAGALYPLEVYVAAGKVDGLAPGVYKYQPAGHSLVKVRDGDMREALADVALGQQSVKSAPVAVVIAGVYERTTGKYSTDDGDNATGSVYPRGVKYVHFEAGHASQNVYLQAKSLGLGTVAIGAFDDGGVKQVLGLRDDERPLYIMPVGRT